MHSELKTNPPSTSQSFLEMIQLLMNLVKYDVFDQNCHFFNQLLTTLVGFDERGLEVFDLIFKNMEKRNFKSDFIKKCRELAHKFYQFRTNKQTDLSEIAQLKDIFLATRNNLEKEQEAKTLPNAPREYKSEVSNTNTSPYPYLNSLYQIALTYLREPLKHTSNPIIEAINTFLIEYETKIFSFNEKLKAHIDIGYIPLLKSYLPYISHLLQAIDELVEKSHKPLAHPDNHYLVSIKLGITLLKITTCFYLYNVTPIKKEGQRLISLIQEEKTKALTLEKLISTKPSCTQLIDVALLNTVDQLEPIMPCERKMANLITQRKPYLALNNYIEFLNERLDNFDKISFSTFQATYVTLIHIMKQLFLLEQSKNTNLYLFTVLEGPFVTRKSLSFYMLQAIHYFLDLLHLTDPNVIKSFMQNHIENTNHFKKIALLLLENFAMLKNSKEINKIKDALMSLDTFSKLMTYYSEFGINKNNLAEEDCLSHSLKTVFPDHMRYQDCFSFNEFLANQYKELESQIPIEEEKKEGETVLAALDELLAKWEVEDQTEKKRIEDETQLQQKEIQQKHNKNLKNRKKKAQKAKAGGLEKKEEVSASVEEKISEQRELYLKAFDELKKQRLKKDSEQQYQDVRENYSKGFALAKERKDHCTAAYCLSGLAEGYLLEAEIHVRQGKSNFINFSTQMEKKQSYQNSFRNATISFKEATRYAEMSVAYYEQEVFLDKDSLTPSIQKQLESISWGLTVTLNKARDELKQLQKFIQNHEEKTSSRLKDLNDGRLKVMEKIGLKAWRSNPNPKNYHQGKRIVYQTILDNCKTIKDNLNQSSVEFAAPLEALHVLHPPSALMFNTSEERKEVGNAFLDKLNDLRQFRKNKSLKLLEPPAAVLSRNKATFYQTPEVKEASPDNDFLSILINLEEAYIRNDQDAKKAYFLSLAKYWEGNPENKLNPDQIIENFKQTIINGIQTNFLAIHDPSLAFLIGVIYFIGIDFANPTRQNPRLDLAITYLQDAQAYLRQKEDPTAILTRLYLTRLQSQTEYKSLMVEDTSKGKTKLDLIIADFELLCTKYELPYAYHFLGQFYEKIAQHDESQRDIYLNKRDQCFAKHLASKPSVRCQ